MQIKDKIVVVTGAASGFGLLTSRMLSDRAATVLGFDLGDAEGRRVVDVTERMAVHAGVDQVVAEHGRVDVLVNNGDDAILSALREFDRWRGQPD